MRALYLSHLLQQMWSEHFGIGVVEYLAAGLLPVCHDSGGPKMDILTEFEGEKIGILSLPHFLTQTHIMTSLCAPFSLS